MCDNLSTILSFLTVSQARWSIAQLGVDSHLHCCEGDTACCILVIAGQVHLRSQKTLREEKTVELSAGDIALVLDGADSTISDRLIPRKDPVSLTRQAAVDRVSWIDTGSQRPPSLVIVGCF